MKNAYSARGAKYLTLGLLVFLGCAGTAFAQSPTPSDIESVKAELQIGLNTLWVILTGCLVFLMNAGFAMLEAGFCRQKNTVSILSKNLIVFTLATVAFWTIGFGVMFGDGNFFWGASGFFLRGEDNSPSTGIFYQGVYQSLKSVATPLSAKFFFELVFSGVAASIVSGAVAERIKFLSFVCFSLFFVAFIYPIAGHWIWGGGWLYHLGFRDFAGSTVVHSVGGWAALVGAVVLGPRLGKYQEGASLALPGHNLALSTLGCLLLWFGWFGFNAGSTMALDPATIGHIAIVTNMAAAMGGIGATLTAWRYFGKPDLSVTINGILGGLVAITASCRFVTVEWAVVIGSIAGVTIVFAVDFFDKLQIDDPVGAVSVHLVCGIWGTLAVSLFAIGPNMNIAPDWILYQEGPARGLLLGGGLAGLKQLFVQMLGITSVSLFTLIASWLAWSSIKLTLGLRVSMEAELKGLDISEHGLYAYSGFFLKRDVPQNSPSTGMGEKQPPSSLG